MGGRGSIPGRGMSGAPFLQGLPILVHRTVVEIEDARVAAASAAGRGVRLRRRLGHRIEHGRGGACHGALLSGTSSVANRVCEYAIDGVSGNQDALIVRKPE